MNLLESGKSFGPNDQGAPRVAKRPNAIKSYDGLAGSALLRRAGKAAGSNALRGDPASMLLAARRKESCADQLGRELLTFYEGLLRQPIPDRILALVEALDAQNGR